MSAASVVRDARWVRSGPTSPRALVPRIVWQLAHWLASKTRSPVRSAAVAGARRGAAMFASQDRKRSGGSANTYSAMWACCAPQNSAHCPR